MKLIKNYVTIKPARSCDCAISPIVVFSSGKNGIFPLLNYSQFQLLFLYYRTLFFHAVSYIFNTASHLHA